MSKQVRSSQSTHPTHRTKHSHNLLFLVVALIFTALVVSRFASVKQLLDTLSQGLWVWVLAASAIHLIYFVLYAVLYKIGFATVDYSSRVRDLIPLVFASLFVNALAPTAGAGGAALFIDDASRRGQPGERTAMGAILVLAADLITLVPFIAFADIFLLARQDLQAYDIAGSVIYVIFAAGLSSLLVLGRVSPGLLERLLSGVHRVANGVGRMVRRGDLLPQEWASKTTSGMVSAGNVLAHHPKEIALTLLWGLFIHLVNLGGLYLLFLAFRYPIDPGVVTAGFAIGIVFWLVTIIPQGVGAAEGIMSLVYVSLGVPQAVAITVVLVFRGLNFWLPLIIGFLMLRRVSLFSSEPEGQTKTQGPALQPNTATTQREVEP